MIQIVIGGGFMGKNKILQFSLQLMLQLDCLYKKP